MQDENPHSLWLSQDAIEAMNGQSSCCDALSISAISIDSRSVGRRDLFFAIKGDRFDGHDFVADALVRGAALAVISKDKSATLKIDPRQVVVVDDVLKGLEDLGRAARARLAGKVVAVTGSVGKTGTKEMMRLAFGASGKVHASVASFNNHWGVPLTLSRTPQDADYGIYEIGMNHPGEIIPLVDLVRPDVAIITTVEPVHLEHFKDEQEIARAKAEIFSGIEPGGTALLNADNRHFQLLNELARKAGVKVSVFGEQAGSDIELESFDLHFDHTVVTAKVFGMSVTYRLGAPGRHIVQNSLAVAGALSLSGADVEAGLVALSDLSAPKGRGARMTLEKTGGDFIVLDESYNANPASMRAAIGLLGSAPTTGEGRRIAVLGDMLELGDTSESLHAGLLSALIAGDVDSVFLCGPHMKALWDVLSPQMRGKYATSSDGLRESLLDTVAIGDVIMVKGSLGSRMGPLVDALNERYAAR